MFPALNPEGFFFCYCCYTRFLTYLIFVASRTHISSGKDVLGSTLWSGCGRELPTVCYVYCRNNTGSS